MLGGGIGSSLFFSSLKDGLVRLDGGLPYHLLLQVRLFFLVLALYNPTRASKNFAMWPSYEQPYVDVTACIKYTRVHRFRNA